MAAIVKGDRAPIAVPVAGEKRRTHRRILSSRRRMFRTSLSEFRCLIHSRGRSHPCPSRWHSHGHSRSDAKFIWPGVLNWRPSRRDEGQDDMNSRFDMGAAQDHHSHSPRTGFEEAPIRALTYATADLLSSPRAKEAEGVLDATARTSTKLPRGSGRTRGRKSGSGRWFCLDNAQVHISDLSSQCTTPRTFSYVVLCNEWH